MLPGRIGKCIYACGHGVLRTSARAGFKVFWFWVFAFKGVQRERMAFKAALPRYFACKVLNAILRARSNRPDNGSNYIHASYR